MNRKIGFISSIVIGSAVAIFLICLIAALFTLVMQKKSVLPRQKSEFARA